MLPIRLHTQVKVLDTNGDNPLWLCDIALVLIQLVFCKTMLAAAVSFACVTLTA